MEIYLVRHTQVAISPEYCYGISDVDLREGFQQDIGKVMEKLSDIKFTKSFMSPLKRCTLLAQSIVENPTSEKALIEMDLGDWELKKWSDLDKDLLDKWMNDFVNIPPPNADNFMDFSMNSVFFFDSLVKDSSDSDTILLVSHSGAIRSIVCHVLNMSLAHAFNFEIDFGGVTKIEIVNDWYKVKYLNL